MEDNFNSNEIQESPVIKKKNNLNTKNLPPFIMLTGGLIALIVCLIKEFEIQHILIVLLITLFSFAIIGTLIKCVVDSFNMKNDYYDFIEDEGEIIDKGE